MDVQSPAPQKLNLENYSLQELANLRKKLERGGRSRILHSVRGVGFVLRAE